MSNEMEKNILHKDCKMYNYYPDSEPKDTSKCDVQFSENQIVVSYEGSDGENCVWRGTEHENGHYECRMESGGIGHATLHRFPNSSFLEGYWEEKEDNDIYFGMWRIDLKGNKK